MCQGYCPSLTHSCGGMQSGVAGRKIVFTEGKETVEFRMSGRQEKSEPIHRKYLIVIQIVALV